jgi:hypothetical protein
MAKPRIADLEDALKQRDRRIVELKHDLDEATVRPRNVGRPLAASEAQCATVLKLHKAGTSLRAIAEETSLGLRTVRTIVDGRKRHGPDHEEAP